MDIVNIVQLLHAIKLPKWDSDLGGSWKRAKRKLACFIRAESNMNWLTDGFLCGFFGMLFVGLPYLIGSGEL